MDATAFLYGLSFILGCCAGVGVAYWLAVAWIEVDGWLFRRRFRKDQGRRERQSKSRPK